MGGKERLGEHTRLYLTKVVGGEQLLISSLPVNPVQDLHSSTISWDSSVQLQSEVLFH